MAVGETLCRLHAIAAGSALVLTGWRGEAELRAWATPGQPYPDAALDWSAGELAGTWWLELDRATESAKSWRRKLVRYLASPPGPNPTVLTLTTTRIRAQHLAEVGADVGVHVLALAGPALTEPGDPPVADAFTRRWTTLHAPTLAEAELARQRAESRRARMAGQ